MRYGRTSRVEAKKAGSRFYFTGERCEARHRAERFTATGVCVECERLASVEANAMAFDTRLKCRIAADAVARRDRIAARRAGEGNALALDKGKPLSCAQVKQRKREAASPFDDVSVGRRVGAHFDLRDEAAL
jgi:hypothetical protein